MKRASIIILTIIWFFALELPLLAQEMKIGYNHLVTYAEVQEDLGKPLGVLVDYWTTMAEKMGVSIKWVGPLPPQRILSYLKQKKIDAVYLASKNKERERLGLFSEKPIMKKQSIVCLRKLSPITKVGNWSDLRYLKKIGALHGYRITGQLEKDYPELNLVIMTHEKFVSDSLSFLIAGKLDAFIFPNKNNVLLESKKKKWKTV